MYFEILGFSRNSSYLDPKLSVDRELAVYKRITEALRTVDRSCEEQGFYCKRPETQHVDCGRVLVGDKVSSRRFTGFY